MDVVLAVYWPLAVQMLRGRRRVETRKLAGKGSTYYSHNRIQSQYQIQPLKSVKPARNKAVDHGQSNGITNLVICGYAANYVKRAC